MFYVQTGGYDTHAGQNTNQANGAYTGLMGTLNDGLFAFYNDLRNQGLFNDTLVLQFSEFGRRISENGSAGTDHGAASVMMALGGGVRGGIYGTAASLRVGNDNPTLENSSQDIRYETDFRSVYAQDHRPVAGRKLDAGARRGFPRGAPQSCIADSPIAQSQSLIRIPRSCCDSGFAIAIGIGTRQSPKIPLNAISISG